MLENFNLDSLEIANIRVDPSIPVHRQNVEVTNAEWTKRRKPKRRMGQNVEWKKRRMGQNVEWN